MKKRCVVVHGNGAVTVADGRISVQSGTKDRGTPYDLDAAFQRGSKISVYQSIPIGPQGTSILLIIDEEPEGK